MEKIEEPEQIEQKSHDKVKFTDSSQVYSREEYAKKDFWNDRFKESKGTFDWYANWKEIKPIWEQLLCEQVIGATKDMD
jgi:hypothetical protein